MLSPLIVGTAIAGLCCAPKRETRAKIVPQPEAVAIRTTSIASYRWQVRQDKSVAKEFLRRYNACPPDPGAVTLNQVNSVYVYSGGKKTWVFLTTFGDSERDLGRDVADYLRTIEATGYQMNTTNPEMTPPPPEKARN